MPLRGMLYDIQRFSLDDGPGIRTTFFLKGCNLRCQWCHNPESIHPEPQLLYYAAKCQSCGACVQICPQQAHALDGVHRFDRKRCNACGLCERVCPSGALLLRGREITPEDVVTEAMKDYAFFASSGGGITFSGGEPLLQPAFLAESLRLLRQRDVHTAVDTAGNVPWSSFAAILPFTNLVLFDLKAFSVSKHRSATGADNEQILRNLQTLSTGTSCTLWVRIPAVRGLNLLGPEDEEWHRMLFFLRNLSRIERIDLLPYHRLGEVKYEALGLRVRTGKEHLFEIFQLERMVEQARALNLPLFCHVLDHQE